MRPPVSPILNTQMPGEHVGRTPPDRVAIAGATAFVSRPWSAHATPSQTVIYTAFMGVPASRLAYVKLSPRSGLGSRV